MTRSVMMKLTLAAVVSVLAFSCGGGPAKRAVRQQARPLPLDAVRLTGGALKQAQDLNGRYLLELEPDRMMAFLREAAGLPKKAEGYEGWDGPKRQLTGHIAGHYLSAVSLMFAATGDPRYKERADDLVAELKAVQDAHGDGYIGAQADREGVPGKTLYEQLTAGDIRSSGFDLNGMWSPWYVQHKIYAGLRDAYRFTGNPQALEVETAFAAWAERVLYPLQDGQIQMMLGTEFGGMNEIAVDLYADTGDERWLALADKFQHRAVIDPLSRGEDILRGKHGNTLVPKLLGSLARYEYMDSEADGNAARFFWDQVALHHSFATGGHGRNEYFGPPDDLSEMIEGRTAETCNVYNMIKMARRLFALDPQIRYADFHERALFNHILGSIDPADGATCYMVPVGQAVAREYQDMQRSFTCCVGSGMESHALHGDGIYYESGDTLWINIYAPSTVSWKAAGVDVAMETAFPEAGSAVIAIEAAPPKEWTLALRRPAWAGEGFAAAVNGAPAADLGTPGSYVLIRRTWAAGDKVEVTLPLTLRLEPLPGDPDRAALMWGPLVLAGDLGPMPERRRRGEDPPPQPPAPPARPESPVLVTDAPAVADWVKPVDGRPGVFRTEATEPAGGLDLVPFHRLHRRTYTAYFDVLTSEKWRLRSVEMLAAREVRKRLEAATVTFVQPGQMQAERDSNQQGGSTTPVQSRGVYGRRATDWFSFDVPVDASSPLVLIATYHTDERAARAFAVLADGVKIGEQRIPRRSPQEPERFFDVEYPIPAEVATGKRMVTIRFEGLDGSETATVYGLRMVRANRR